MVVSQKCDDWVIHHIKIIQMTNRFSKKSYLCQRKRSVLFLSMSTRKESVLQALDLAGYKHNLYSVKDSYADKLLEYYRMQANRVNADYFYCFNGSSSNLVVISFLFQLSSSFLILLKVVDMFAF